MRFDVAYIIGLILFVLFCFMSSKLYKKEGLEGKELGKIDPVGDGNDVDSERQFVEQGLDYYERRKSLMGGNTMKMKFPELDSFYRYEEERPLGEQLVLDVMESSKGPSAFKKEMDGCGKLRGCNDIKNQNPEKGCGYCAKSDKFMIGNAQGPMADICDSGWSFTPESCKKNKEKAICGNITSCLGVVQNEPTKICGWCPQAKSAFVASEKNGVKIPKYDDDKCNSPLLSGDKCRNDPICGAKFDTGPHSAECLRKIWKEVGCSAKSIVSSNMNNPKDPRVIRWNAAAVPKVYNDMRIVAQGAKQGNIDAYRLCYGKEKAKEAQKLGRIGPKFQERQIKGKVAAKRALAEAKMEAARAASNDAYASRKAAQVILGSQLDNLSCQGDELWDLEDGGLFVDQRIRDCKKKGGGFNLGSAAKRQRRSDYS
jgi:hypothetical protein